MSYKRWVKLFMLLIAISFGSLALFNYAIDPLWTFCHSNRFNNAQPGFNERQLKTNRAYFCGLDRYDTLLLGSSRVTYINQYDFKPLNVFNYASVSMYPKEYSAWIKVAKKIKKKPFKTIILGVDFWGSNSGTFAQQQMKQTPDPITYYNKTVEPFYRYKMLFTLDTLKKSIESIKHSYNLGTTDYTRSNIKQTIHVSKKRKARAVQTQRGLYINLFYGKGYRYNKKLKNIFLKIKRENPNTHFIVFTTPISFELYKILYNQGKFDDYKRWLQLLVDVFGEVYDFMGSNTITNNPKNYADLHHIYPDIGTLIAHKILGIEDKKIPKDFGVLVTKRNIKEHLKKQEDEIKKIERK